MKLLPKNNGRDDDVADVMDEYENKQSLTLNLTQLEMRYNGEQRSIWCLLRSKPIPALTLTMLRDIRTAQDSIAKFCLQNQHVKPKYLIWMSDSEKVFNLGLDLSYLHELISTNDRAKLDEYLMLCIDVLYINLMKLDIKPLITICLARGKAYGGGFEAAISSDIVVAEKNACFCFPEVRQNMLPSLGTLNMLFRRFPPQIIQQLVFKGQCHDAESLHLANVIEHVVEPGDGIAFIKNKIAKLDHRHDIYAELYDSIIRSTLVTYEELDAFKHKWLDSVLSMNTRDIQRLKRLADKQKILYGA